VEKGELKFALHRGKKKKVKKKVGTMEKGFRDGSLHVLYQTEEEGKDLPPEAGKENEKMFSQNIQPRSNAEGDNGGKGGKGRNRALAPSALRTRGGR